MYSANFSSLSFPRKSAVADHQHRESFDSDEVFIRQQPPVVIPPPPPPMPPVTPVPLRATNTNVCKKLKGV